MTASATLRRQIETALANRIPSALTPVQRSVRSVMPTGTYALDELLQGGFPSAAITELVGVECSGRTTVALSYLKVFTEATSVCAWIDVADSLDPEAAAANGVDLERLLWVRCGVMARRAESTSSQPVVGGMCALQPEPVCQTLQGCGGNHPRTEGQGMSQAIRTMLQAHGGGLYDKHPRREKRSIGTPGAPNRPLVFRSGEREEQIASDRLPPRRGGQVAAPRCAEPLHERRSGASESTWTAEPSAKSYPSATPAKRPWDALDHALRATDLLLQAGGFSVIVLDLGSTPAEMAWRIPLATWFRFRAACERTRVSLVLLTQHPCARSSAELVVRMSGGRLEADGKVMTGVVYSAETARHRFQSTTQVVSIRKPPQREHNVQWRTGAAWAVRR